MTISQADIELLAALERATNPGNPGGVSCVRSILHYLNRGDEESAAMVRMVEGDKTRVYPEIEAQLYKMFGCRLHGHQECSCHEKDWAHV
jgi:hypothetical protein